MLLFINACVRENSRTERLARALLERAREPVTELRLTDEELAPLDREALECRTALSEAGDFSAPEFRYARQFRDADTIVIAAPYWDLSFPALLKIYLENICVMGLVSRYTPDGRPEGLCRARRLYYVTTAGGPLFPAFGFGQIEALAQNYFGIPETVLIRAENLDIADAAPEAILREVIDGLPQNL